MPIALKQTIINYIFDNINKFQLVNATREYFRHYIYDPKGEHLIGGETVSDFITDACKLLSSK